MHGSLTKTELSRLAERYFTDELGLPPEGVPIASSNILSFYETLLRIDQRLNNNQSK